MDFEENGFIKVTVDKNVSPSDKAALNRKGNQLFNIGEIEKARRVFMTTGYSDGLIRVGNHYKSEGRLLDALRMYWIAPDRDRVKPIIEKMAAVIQDLLSEDQNERASI